MATVVPWRGIFYNRDKVQDLSLVVAPPYDIISPQEQDLLYARHPQNIIRLILNKETPADHDQDNRYTRAAAFYRSWLKEGILIRAPQPHLYFLRQEFTLPPGYIPASFSPKTRLTRHGFIALLRLEDYTTGVVLPHEKTQRKPKMDRLALMEACRANFCQIFVFYEDKEGRIPALYEKVFSAPDGPTLKVTDNEGTYHTLWMVKDQLIIKEITRFMEPQKIFIADGHHRYETALAYREKQVQNKQNTSGRESFNFTMAYFTNMADEGLLILPTHRVVRGLPDFQPALFLKQIHQYFKIESFSFPPQDQKAACTHFLKELARAGHMGKSLGMVLNGYPQYFLLTLKREDIWQKITEHLHPTLKKLEVNLLHLLILQELLNISNEDLAAGKYVHYLRDPYDAGKEVLSGKGQIAFFLNPPQVAQVRDVSLAGETMPSKSTYFYPKLLSGLVINPLEPDEEISLE
ncbi:MAG: DUF1015 domain-containing protein [Thermodesulfobacteriota bacterium]